MPGFRTALVLSLGTRDDGEESNKQSEHKLAEERKATFITIIATITICVLDSHFFLEILSLL
jgi:hypothetical protein